MRALDGVDAATLYRIIQGEHPQTLALILAHSDQSLAAKLVRFFQRKSRRQLSKELQD